jgi:hypothetical protein
MVAELGAPGALAGGVLLLGIVLLIRRCPRALRPAVAACCATGVLMAFDHYLWTMAPGRVMAWAPLAVVAALGRRMAPYTGDSD